RRSRSTPSKRNRTAMGMDGADTERGLRQKSSRHGRRTAYVPDEPRGVCYKRTAAAWIRPACPTRSLPTGSRGQTGDRPCSRRARILANPEEAYYSTVCPKKDDQEIVKGT